MISLFKYLGKIIWTSGEYTHASQKIVIIAFIFVMNIIFASLINFYVFTEIFGENTFSSILMFMFSLLSCLAWYVCAFRWIPISNAQMFKLAQLMGSPQNTIIVKNNKKVSKKIYQEKRMSLSDYAILMFDILESPYFDNKKQEKQLKLEETKASLKYLKQKIQVEEASNGTK